MDTQLEHDQFKSFQNYQRPSHQLKILLHDLESPRNVGGAFRLADALGVEELILSGGTPQPPNRKIRQTSRSCDKYVKYRYSQEPLECMIALRKEGFILIALEITANSMSLADFTAQLETGQQKICLIPGSESKGLDADILNACDQAIHIPMFGENSSMNVIHACAIASYSIGAS